MPHDHSSLFIFSGLISGMTGMLLIVCSSNWGDRGYRKLATFFLLAGFACIVMGGILITMSLTNKSLH
jgi:hypothetical protein